MKRRILIILLCAAVLTSGCASILEGDTLSITEHSGISHARPSGGQAEASSFDELKEAIFDLIENHAESGTIYVYSYGSDVQSDINRACYEIKTNDPVGAYALSDISGVATKIVSYFEVEMRLSYKRTKKQVDSRVTVSTLRYFKSELLGFMSDYIDEAVVRTDISGVTSEDVLEYVREIYYQNPRDIVVLPGAAAESFPPDGDDKIIELKFGYIEAPSILKMYSASLLDTVRGVVESVGGGDNDGAILLALATSLMDSCVYDEGTAKILAEHGTQNFAATACGALIKGSAVGEGYAMAYKALCDELGFECRVVLGYLDGMVHAWNIVLLFGNYYHIDVSMCDALSIEDAFLVSDDRMPDGYSWDRGNTVKCSGELSYSDFAVTEEPEPPLEE